MDLPLVLELEVTNRNKMLTFIAVSPSFSVSISSIPSFASREFLSSPVQVLLFMSKLSVFADMLNPL